MATPPDIKRRRTTSKEGAELVGGLGGASSSREEFVLLQQRLGDLERTGQIEVYQLKQRVGALLRQNRVVQQQLGAERGDRQLLQRRVSALEQELRRAQNAQGRVERRLARSISGELGGSQDSQDLRGSGDTELADRSQSAHGSPTDAWGAAAAGGAAAPTLFRQTAQAGIRKAAVDGKLPQIPPP